MFTNIKQIEIKYDITFNNEHKDRELDIINIFNNTNLESINLNDDVILLIYENYHEHVTNNYLEKKQYYLGVN